MKDKKAEQDKDRLKKKLGKIAEKTAVKHLKKKGLKIVAKNFATKNGEIDVIARISDVVVFVEVRSRTKPFFLDPGVSVNKKKQDKITKTALDFVRKNRIQNHSFRFDIVSVIFNEDCSLYEIKHFENAFTPNDSQRNSF